MGIFCSDKSMTALAKLGYNVVRHPSAHFRPMLLIGKQSGEFLMPAPFSPVVTAANGPGGGDQLVERPPFYAWRPYAPELNPIENVWEYLRANKLAITVFDETGRAEQVGPVVAL
jgi:hypothetical protein